MVQKFNQNLLQDFANKYVMSSRSYSFKNFSRQYLSQPTRYNSKCLNNLAHFFYELNTSRCKFSKNFTINPLENLLVFSTKQVQFKFSHVYSEKSKVSKVLFLGCLLEQYFTDSVPPEIVMNISKVKIYQNITSLPLKLLRVRLVFNTANENKFLSCKIKIVINAFISRERYLFSTNVLSALAKMIKI